jgi:hypothetical protein
LKRDQARETGRSLQLHAELMPELRYRMPLMEA